MPKYPCPCCRCFTLDAVNEYTICPVCFWEDDPVQREFPDRSGGANGVCLLDARENYRRFGACREDLVGHVRGPFPDELSE